MERSWHRETPVVLKVCVCWQESFLCVQGQKRPFFRTEFLAKTYKASSGVTQVSDIIRQIDVGLSRFRKMIETLPATVSRVGLEVQTSDLTIMLLRSLPHDVRSALCMQQVMLILTFALLRLRFETQQRMFAELSGPSSSGARGVHALEGAETAEEWWDTIRKVTTILSMPRKKILMINGNGTKMCRFGSVLLLRQEREVPTPL